MKEELLDEVDITEGICEVAISLHEKNMLAAADGNISYKYDDDTIYITPRGQSKAKIHKDDIAVISMSGEVLTGEPSSEMLMHLKIYQTCPEAKAVIHAHPPVATAWTIARPELSELPKECISELILACGAIPIVPFAFPGTEEMGHKLDPFLPDSRVLLLSRHGALTWGESLTEAHRGMERLEHAATILHAAVTLGGITPLPEDVVEKLKEKRRELGKVTL